MGAKEDVDFQKLAQIVGYMRKEIKRLENASDEEVVNGMWTFNGKMYDPARIDADVPLGATEDWTFQNRSGQDHPIHLHDVNFHVVSGGPAGGPGSEWKETVNVPAWSSVTVRAQFADFTGVYMFHCHILEHEDHMLMAQVRVG